MTNLKEKTDPQQKEPFDYDFIVIGSGPAGIHAAVQAAKLNKRVCIIEKTPSKIGGSWIHTGTLPSKTLREALDAITNIRNHVGGNWVRRIVDDLNTEKLYGRARKVSLLEEELIRQHLKNNTITLIEGYGALENDYSVRVESSEKGSFILSGEKIMLATGSRPRRPDNVPFDGWRIVDSDEVLALEQMPRSMTIYGAGIIGCEYACIFGALGVSVTMIDARERILAYLDHEIVKELQKFMELLGVKFILNKSFTGVEMEGPQVKVIADDYSIECDVFFFAAGRNPCTERIGLERMNIATDDRGNIKVNQNFQTRISTIYAAGDIVGPPALAATASQQGRYVACHAFGFNIGAFPKDYPVGVYTIPESSMVGKTEETLQKEGVDYVVGRAAYNEIARGYIRGDNHGLLKLLICKKTCKILGIHIVGADACNLVHIGLAFMQRNGYAQDLITMIFNYPTLAEGYRIAAFNGLNKIFKDGRIRSPEEMQTLKEVTGPIQNTIKIAKTS